MSEGKHFGKYRARVRNNRDPLSLGRLQVTVPAFPGIHNNWALPCVPYAGNKVGFLALPPNGAMVWIEFEAGDPSHPIWTGCFWEDGQMPVRPAIPEKKFLVTEHTSVIIDDTKGKGGVTLDVKSPAVKTPIKLTLDSEGLTLDIKPAKVHVGPKDVTVELPTSKVVMTSQATKVTVGPSKAELTGKEIALQTGPASIKMQQAKIEAQLGPGRVEVSSEAVKLACAAAKVDLTPAMVQAQCGGANQKMLTAGNIILSASGAEVLMGQGMVNVNKGALEVM